MVWGEDCVRLLGRFTLTSVLSLGERRWSRHHPREQERILGRGVKQDDAGAFDDDVELLACRDVECLQRVRGDLHCERCPDVYGYEDARPGHLDFLHRGLKDVLSADVGGRLEG